MLENIRNFKDSIIIKIIFATLLIAFVFWGAGDLSKMNNNKNIALIDNAEPITSNELEIAKSHEIKRIQNMTGQVLSEADQQAFNINGRVLNQLITERVMSNLASEYDILLSDDLLANLIQSNPQFYDQNGKFSPEIFKKTLAYMGMKEKNYLEKINSYTAQSMLVSNLIENNKASPAIYEAVINNLKTTKKVAILKLPKFKATAKVSVSDAKLKEFYNNNSNLFKQPANYNISILKIEHQKLAKNIKVSEQEIKDYYEHNLDEFIKPANWRYYNLKFASLEDAEAAHKKLSKAKNKLALLRKDYQNFYNEAVENTLNANLVTNLNNNKNNLSAILQNEDGSFSIFYIEQHTKKIVTAFKNAKSQISDALRNKKIEAKFMNLATEIDDLVAAGNDLKAINEQFKFDLKSHKALTTAQLAKLGQDIPDFVKIVTELDKDEISTTLYNNDGNILYLVAMDNFNEAKISDFATIKNKVKKAYLDDYFANKNYKDLMALAEKKASYENLRKFAVNAEADLQHVNLLKAKALNAKKYPNALYAEIFNKNKNDYSLVIEDAKNYYLALIRDSYKSKLPSDIKLDEIKARIHQTERDIIYGQIVNWLINKYNVKTVSN